MDILKASSNNTKLKITIMSTTLNLKTLWALSKQVSVKNILRGNAGNAGKVTQNTMESAFGAPTSFLLMLSAFIAVAVVVFVVVPGVIAAKENKKPVQPVSTKKKNRPPFK